MRGFVSYFQILRISKPTKCDLYFFTWLNRTLPGFIVFDLNLCEWTEFSPFIVHCYYHLCCICTNLVGKIRWEYWFLKIPRRNSKSFIISNVEFIDVNCVLNSFELPSFMMNSNVKMLHWSNNCCIMLILNNTVSFLAIGSDVARQIHRGRAFEREKNAVFDICCPSLITTLGKFVVHMRSKYVRRCEVLNMKHFNNSHASAARWFPINKVAHVGTAKYQ